MSSYTRYELHEYSTNGGGNAWSNGGGGYVKSGGPYGNASGFSFDGGSGYGSSGSDYRGYGSSGSDYRGYVGGNMATGGQLWSGDYGKDSGYYGRRSYGGEYSSNGGQMMTPGGGSGGFRIHENKAQNMAASTVVADDLISALVPTSFPPGTDPKFIECFNRMDRDRNGSICDQELQSALTTFDQRFSLRTVHLLMFLFTGSNMRDVTPKEFVPLIRSLQSWKVSFEMHDRDKNGSLDEMELREAMRSMGYNLSPFVLKLLVSKFDKSSAKSAIEYDYFIECCLIIRGLTEKFKTKEDPYTGTATFTYDEFLLNILPFVIMN